MTTLEMVWPELAKEWSVRNLPLTAADVAPKSNRKVWWRGPCGHEWQTRVADRTDGHGCPFCFDNKLLTGFNDLSTEHPELAAEWSSQNLPLTPAKVKSKSRLNVWWQCGLCGYTWRAVIDARVKGCCRCPACLRKEGAVENAWKSDKPFRTRMVEEAFAFYAEQAGLKVLRNTDPGIGIDVTVYLPEIKAAFEVSRRSRTWQIERIKNEFCWRSRIRLVRVVEANAAMYQNCKCIRRCDTSLESLGQALEAVFELLRIPVKSDVSRDMKAIHLRYKERK